MSTLGGAAAYVTLDSGETWSTQHNQPTAELYQVDISDDFPYRLYAGQQDKTTISVLTATRPRIPTVCTSPVDSAKRLVPMRLNIHRWAPTSTTTWRPRRRVRSSSKSWMHNAIKVLPSHLYDNAWSLAFFTYSHERYEPCTFPNGSFHGTPEEAFEIDAAYFQPGLGGEELEPLSQSGVAKSTVEAYEAFSRRIIFARDQRRSQLESIGRAKGMDGEQPSRAPSHLLSGGNGVGMVEEKSQPSKGIIQYCAWQRLFPVSSKDGRFALDQGSPPNYRNGARANNLCHFT
jgi:hypothetical protein